MKIKDEKELTKTLVKEIQNEIQRWKTERILTIFLDENGNITFKKIISFGYHKDYANCDIKLFINLLDSITPVACVCSHNHTRNAVRSSPDDDSLHHLLKQICEDRNVIMYDHIIIMKDNNEYYSYREQNKLNVIPKKILKKEDYI